MTDPAVLTRVRRFRVCWGYATLILFAYVLYGAYRWVTDPTPFRLLVLVSYAALLAFCFRQWARFHAATKGYE